MGTGIYKTKNGKQVELTSREVKAFIMKQNNWTADEYKKKYDIFKNKLRAFESYEKSHGRVRTQSAVQLLYKEAKSKETHGSDYRPSLQMKRIRSFTSVSSGKAGKKALTGAVYSARRTKLYEETTEKSFEKFIEKVPLAQEIMKTITDPVKREEALSDLADKMKAKIDEEGKRVAQENIPVSSEVIGSDTVDVDFDISQYL